jgi:hypothetical protein
MLFEEYVVYLEGCGLLSHVLRPGPKKEDLWIGEVASK